MDGLSSFFTQLLSAGTQKANLFTRLATKKAASPITGLYGCNAGGLWFSRGFNSLSEL
jgi:hypothetical protein